MKRTIENKKNYKAIAAIVICIFLFAGCNAKVETKTNSEGTAVSIIGGADGPTSVFIAEKIEEKEEKPKYINPEGKNLEERIFEPKGYKRIKENEGSFGCYVRKYPLKSDGAKVLLYDQREKGNQNVHVAVFGMPIENNDLQQCADSVIRMYAEYFWETNQHDKIAFHFTNGFLAEYSRWKEGDRIAVNGNNVVWTGASGYDDSYESFLKYLKTVFTYAGTLSMELETTSIELKDAKIGDVFLYGASPGHVVMICDICENTEGKRAYLLCQGYMPAQEFHILKNYEHIEDPWYYDDEIIYPLKTPEYTFKEGSLKRLCYND